MAIYRQIRIINDIIEKDKPRIFYRIIGRVVVEGGNNLKITKFTVEHSENVVTDNKNPRFSYAVEKTEKQSKMVSAKISVGEWSVTTSEQILIPYGGDALKPLTDYKAELEVRDNLGGVDRAEVNFSTGRLGSLWKAKWITDGDYKFKEKKVSPVPLAFRKNLKFNKPIKRAVINCTAIGIYEIEINREKVGREYFAPGFTSYKTTLQYQTYDATELLKRESLIKVTVADGWAVGSFGFVRKNRITADRQALLLELKVEFEDGTEDIISTDESWEVTRESRVRAADFYDGETYDAAIDDNAINWHAAAEEKIKISPNIVAAFGAPVVERQILTPISVTERGSEIIYDFGQNFAGVVKMKLNAEKGQKIIVKHAEILNRDGGLMTEFLRSAKCTLTYICRGGVQEYSPKFTYMGFRYVSVTGIKKEDITLSAIVLCSDIKENGKFECSDKDINKLQSNIVWSAKSNFVDIPTDCPQRDERMGWTGDIAVFAPTVCYNFDMSRFFEKWLNDLKSEQLKTGGLPKTIPSQGCGFPAVSPNMAVDFWGDACILVPYAEYIARGDKKLLAETYPNMKKYVKACKFWAGLLSVGKRRYIWHTPAVFHYGDWVAPDVPKMTDWQKRSKYTATASLCRTSGLLAEIAEILGYEDDRAYYRELSQKTADAYVSVFSDGNGKLKEEFQTAYVLPLAFGIFPEAQRKKAASNLARLVQKNDYCIGTGFPGTPYILFALADNGYPDVAYKMLLNKKCPSWLYEVKTGATTVWERWDGLDENGECPIGDDGISGGMISYNHYASGAVGDFLYRRVLGVEPLAGGYKKFRTAPVIGGGLTWAKGEVDTPYGKITARWKIDGDRFKLNVSVPVGTECEAVLPDGQKFQLSDGFHDLECKIN